MLGAALIVIGGTVFLRGLSVPAVSQERELGDVVTATQGPSPIVPWATGLAVLAGLALVSTGRRRKA